MDYLKKLEMIFKKNHGTILTSDLNNEKIPRIYLNKLIEAGKIVKVRRGVYVLQESIEDEMFILQRKYPKLVYSHETALFLHGMTDRTPFEYAVTFPSGYKVVGTVSESCKTYYIKTELHQLGVHQGTTSFGNPITLYNVERTICDLLRSRNRIDQQVILDGLKAFTRTKNPDYHILAQYAKKLRVEKLLRGYLEVLQ